MALVKNNYFNLKGLNDKNEINNKISFGNNINKTNNKTKPLIYEKEKFDYEKCLYVIDK